MLDPFMNDSPRKPNKPSRVVEEAQLAQRYGQAINNSAPANPWIRWFGNLLIKVGTKLTQENPNTRSANRIA
ncbi:MAG TPA: hypothetical protein VLX29_01815 [Nitrospirota bacterium]|nr:hypothetical protein [Nitrospirota bacterium]